MPSAPSTSFSVFIHNTPAKKSSSSILYGTFHSHIMFALRARALHRLYSTSHIPPSIKLIAELRKQTSASISKAHEALAATNNDLTAALEWLKNDLSASSASSAAKLAKVSNRTTNQGLVGLAVLSRGAGAPRATGGTEGGVRAAMVEMNCETDFVARNEVFGKLLDDVAYTAAFLSEPAWTSTLLEPFPVSTLLRAPLLSRSNPDSASNLEGKTVEDAVKELSVRVGEKVGVRRAVTTVKDAPLPQHRDIALRAAAYAHGSIHPHLKLQGHIASLALLGLKSPRLPHILGEEKFQKEFEVLERAIARQISGFPTAIIRVEDAEDGACRVAEMGDVLYEQPFMMMHGTHGALVREVLDTWARQQDLVKDNDEEAGGVEVLQFAKWTVGESFEEDVGEGSEEIQGKVEA